MPRVVELTLPDGRIAEIDAPDNFSDRQVMEMLQKQYAPQQPAQEVAPPSPAALGGGFPSPQEELQTQLALQEQAKQQATQTPEKGMQLLGQQMTPEQTKALFEATGGMGFGVVGGLAGTSLGPAGTVGGTLAGGAAGEMAGRALYGAVTGESLESQFQGLLKTGEESLLYGMGGEALGPALKMTGRWLAGITPSSVEMAQTAEKLGIPMGIFDVKDVRTISGKAQKFFGKVIGVFPFTTAPIRSQAGIKKELLEQAPERLLNAVGPNMTLQKAGVDVYNAAKRSSKSFRRMSSLLYKKFYKEAERLGDPAIFSMEPFKKPLEEVGDIITLDVPRPMQNILQEIKDAFNKGAFAVSPRKLRDWQERLNKVGAGSGGNQTFFYNQMKQAMENAFNTVDLPINATEAQKEAAAILKPALEAANKHFAQGMALFDSPGGQAIARVDKNIFKPVAYVKKGTRVPDSLAPTLLEPAMRTPNTIKDLKDIVGEQPVRDMYRSWMTEAVNKHVARESGEAFADGAKSFNWKGWANDIGLNTPSGRDTLKEALRGTGVTPTQLDKLVNLGVMHERNMLTDPSSFVARRTILSPKRAVGGALLGSTTVATGGYLASAGFIGISMAISKALASPRHLRLLTTAVNNDLPFALRRAAYAKLARGLVESTDDNQKTTNKEPLDALSPISPR